MRDLRNALDEIDGLRAVVEMRKELVLDKSYELNAGDTLVVTSNEGYRITLVSSNATTLRSVRQ